MLWSLLLFQVLEEEQIALKQELDETQNSSNAMEEELADTQVCVCVE